MKKNFAKIGNGAVTKILSAMLVAGLVLTGCGQKTDSKPSEPIKTETSIADITEPEVKPEVESNTNVTEEKAPEETEAPVATPAPEVEEAEVGETNEEEIFEEWTPFVKTGTSLYNGNFSDGLNGFDLFSNAGEMSYEVEKNNLVVTLDGTGPDPWSVQLKQDNIKLEKGQWYRISVVAKSNISRKATFGFQKNGMEDNIWTSYCPDTKMELTKGWQTFSQLFQMTEATDRAAVFNVSLGTIDGEEINKEHTISIQSIKLEKMPDDFIDSLKSADNLLANADFSYDSLLWEASVISPAKASTSFKNNSITFDISDVGEVDWNVQLKQHGITLKKNHHYFLSFKATTDTPRTFKVGLMNQDYTNWYGGGDLILKGIENQEMLVTFANRICDDDNVQLMISLGQIEGQVTPGSKITFSDFQLFDKTEATDAWLKTLPPAPPAPVYDHAVGTEMIPFSTMTQAANADGVATISQVGEDTVFTISNCGTDNWHVQRKYENISLDSGATYSFTFDATSSVTRKIAVGIFNSDYSNCAKWEEVTLTDVAADKTHTFTFKYTGPSITNAQVNINLGKIDTDTPAQSVVTLGAISLVKTAEAPDPSQTPVTSLTLTCPDDADTVAAGGKWMQYAFSVNELIGEADPSDVTSITFNGTGTFCVMYNNKAFGQTPYPADEDRTNTYTFTDILLENAGGTGPFIQIGTWVNLGSSFTVDWSVATEDPLAPISIPVNSQSPDWLLNASDASFVTVVYSGTDPGKAYNGMGTFQKIENGNYINSTINYALGADVTATHKKTVLVRDLKEALGLTGDTSGVTGIQFGTWNSGVVTSITLYPAATGAKPIDYSATAAVTSGTELISGSDPLTVSDYGITNICNLKGWGGPDLTTLVNDTHCLVMTFTGTAPKLAVQQPWVSLAPTKVIGDKAIFTLEGIKDVYPDDTDLSGLHQFQLAGNGGSTTVTSVKSVEIVTVQ